MDEEERSDGRYRRFRVGALGDQGEDAAARDAGPGRDGLQGAPERVVARGAVAAPGHRPVARGPGRSGRRRHGPRNTPYRPPGTPTPSSVTYFTPASLFVIVNASRTSPTCLSVVDRSSHLAATTDS